MNIRKIDDNEKTEFIDLLLIADEQVSMIERYLGRGEMFALYDEDVKAVCVVTREGEDVFELKNIATYPQYQRQGYGQMLVSHICDHFKGAGRTMYVGTGDSPTTLNFYTKCGFVRSHTVKDFFVDNYDHAIYDNGRQLVDMVYMKRYLGD